jgi:hypothetical protein
MFAEHYHLSSDGNIKNLFEFVKTMLSEVGR